MEEDALMELGNVILTSCTVSFADTFGIGLEQTSLPEVVRGRCSDILVSDRFGGDSRVLFLEVDFDLHNGGIAGIVLIALGIASANALRERVRIYLDALEA
jgi:chemotaxis protein CheC